MRSKFKTDPGALIVALSQRAFELLGVAIAELPASADPAADLVEAGVAVFRRFALDHASLFRLPVQQTLAPAELTGQARPAATAAMAGLKARIERLAAAGLLGERTIDAAACEFLAFCEGLAAIELRGLIHDGRRHRSGATPSAPSSLASPSTRTSRLVEAVVAGTLPLTGRQGDRSGAPGCTTVRRQLHRWYNSSARLTPARRQ